MFGAHLHFYIRSTIIADVNNANTVGVDLIIVKILACNVVEAALARTIINVSIKDSRTRGLFLNYCGLVIDFILIVSNLNCTCNRISILLIINYTCLENLTFYLVPPNSF